MKIDDKIDLILDAISEKKGYDTEVLDLRNKANFTDFFIITSASNSSQFDAIIENVEYKMSEIKEYKINADAKKSKEWALLDFGDIIVHIFDIDARNYYDLERLWKEIEK